MSFGEPRAHGPIRSYGSSPVHGESRGAKIWNQSYPASKVRDKLAKAQKAEEQRGIYDEDFWGQPPVPITIVPRPRP